MAKKNTAVETEAPAFEKLLAEAEDLAEKMDEGGLTLDESIRAYQRGVENLKRCSELLREAEDKVQVLLEKNGAFRLEDLDAPEATDDEEDDDGEDGY